MSPSHNFQPIGYGKITTHGRILRQVAICFAVQIGSQLAMGFYAWSVSHTRPPPGFYIMAGVYVPPVLLVAIERARSLALVVLILLDGVYAATAVNSFMSLVREHRLSPVGFVGMPVLIAVLCYRLAVSVQWLRSRSRE